MLTRKQYDLLAFIHDRIQDEGVPPSFDEMKEALDLKSKSGIHRLITALEERGFIRRLPHRARALEVLRLPENHEDAGKDTAPSVSVGGTVSQFQPPQRSYATESESTDIPVIGRIAAGTPIEALQETSHHVGVPSVMLSNGGDHYALEVQGESMIDVGIHDGDVVVINRRDSAENGDIVVALVEDQEATLKRLRRKDGMIALEAANPAFETRLFKADQVKVQGRLVGLIRTY